MQTTIHDPTREQLRGIVALGREYAVRAIADGNEHTIDDANGDRIPSGALACLAAHVGHEPGFLERWPFGSAIRDAREGASLTSWLVSTGYGHLVVSARAALGALRIGRLTHGGLTAGAAVDAMPASARWTTWGSVRGGCGHEHVTHAEATRCLSADCHACSRMPGGHSYSDREIRLCVDGDVDRYHVTSGPGMSVEVAS